MDGNPRFARSWANQNVIDIFEAQASATPQRVAIRYEGNAITYEELNSRANQLARYLQRRGVGLESLVGVCLDCSLEAIVSVLGVLKVGGAYVILDPSQPRQRIGEIIKHARLQIAVTSAAFLPHLSSKDLLVVELDKDSPIILTQSRENLSLKVNSDNLAYVTYTSGSTGSPKGISLTHRSITNGLYDPPFETNRQDEICSLNSPLSFGFSVSRLFLPLLSGVTLVVFPDQLSKDSQQLVAEFESQGITSAALVTPQFQEIVFTGPTLTKKLQGLRTLTIGGSPLTPELLARSRKLLPNLKLLNGYAASEIGGAAVVWTIEGEESIATESIGRPFANTKIYILDAEMNPVSDEAAGEVYVAAEHLARGYLNNPSLTAERFVPNPFNDSGCSRLFRTGDRGRKLSNGNIQILGRLDHQVKVRGFRIDLGEVARALLATGMVAEAIVLHDNGGGGRLVAYIAEGEGDRSVWPLLRAQLREYLPEYMIPAACLCLRSLPKTPSGKIDPGALPSPASVSAQASAEYAEPRTDLERAVVEVWSDVLGLDSIGICDNFFELGGQSLLAVQVVAQIRDRIGVQLSPQSIFKHPTIADLCKQVIDAQT